MDAGACGGLAAGRCGETPVQAYEERRAVERQNARQATMEQEGGKSKPWSRREHLKFINNDPDVIRLFIAWLRLLGVPSDRVTCRVSIHESADVRAAERFWAGVVGIAPGELQRTTLKRYWPCGLVRS